MLDAVERCMDRELESIAEPTDADFDRVESQCEAVAASQYAEVWLPPLAHDSCLSGA